MRPRWKQWGFVFEGSEHLSALVVPHDTMVTTPPQGLLVLRACWFVTLVACCGALGSQMLMHARLIKFFEEAWPDVRWSRENECTDEYYAPTTGAKLYVDHCAEREGYVCTFAFMLMALGLTWFSTRRSMRSLRARPSELIAHRRRSLLVHRTMIANLAALAATFSVWSWSLPLVSFHTFSRWLISPTANTPPLLLIIAWLVAHFPKRSAWQ